MSNNIIASIITVVFVIIILFFANCALVTYVKTLEQQAIEYNYAEFNRTNGNWQWITPTNK
jgi:hypothetical protein